MNVFLHTFPWFISPANTDWRVNHNMLLLPAHAPPEAQLKVIAAQSQRIALLASYRYLRGISIIRMGLHPRLRGTRWAPIIDALPLCRGELRRANAQVIFSHGYFPSNARETPVLWETGFEPPEGALAAGLSERDIEQEYRIKRELGHRSAIVALSNQDAVERMAAYAPELAPRLRAIPFFRPYLGAMDESAVAEKHSAATRLRILFVGLQARRKGLPLLIEALKQLPGGPGEVELDVVSDFRDGDVPIPSGLNVRLHGRLPGAQTQQLFARAQVFAMPSRRESYGLVYIEAMAAGCAVIAPDRMPQQEILDHGRAGVLVDPAEVGPLARALAHLRDHPAERLSIAQAGRQRFLRNYSPQAVARTYVAAFADAIQHRAM